MWISMLYDKASRVTIKVCIEFMSASTLKGVAVSLVNIARNVC